MKRRDILKSLSIAPFAGGFLPLESTWDSPGAMAASGLTKSKPSIYESIGVDTVINCRGTFTIIGGSIERPEVLKAMEAASGNFVQYDELAYGIGERLAQLTKAEWGIVTAGCAAGMKHVTAACVTGGNPEKLIRIPDLTGFDKTEVVIPRYARNAYDHAIRNIGVEIINVDSPEELEQALNPRTAMIYLTSGPPSFKGQPLSLEAIVNIAKPKNIPVLMDAAAEDLTIPCVHLQRGATIVAYSGGKAICGPQCAGLVLGNKDILMSAWQASSPHHGPGRDNKVGKEEMFGMVAAVEAWTTRDHEGEWKTWLSWLDNISKKVLKVDGVKTSIKQPEGLNNRAPRLIIAWDPDKLHLTGDELAEEVARKKPRLAIGSGHKNGMTSVNITPSQMQPGQDKIVADRLYGLLSQKRNPRSKAMKTPAANLSDRWEVVVEFFSSKSHHTLFLEQDGNWIKGSHKGDFSVRELVGTIEGDQVKLRSRDRHIADHITFIFYGSLKGDTITGSVYLGEYMNAKFKASRNNYPEFRQRITVPGGPPLAT